MQNRYTRDIGDFAKYGLLRTLCLPTEDNPYGLRLGVVWYLVPDEGNGDGRFTHYLEANDRNHKSYRIWDPVLYDALQRIGQNGRCVQAVRRSGILGISCSFYESILDWHGTTCMSDRVIFRQTWHKNAVESTKDCDVVFLDPDNGLECKVSRYDRKRGGKFVYMDEMTPYIERGQSVIVYQHLNRICSAEAQIHGWITLIQKQLGKTHRIFGLRWHRSSGRVFFVISAQQHRPWLIERAKILLAWHDGHGNKHFTPVGDWT